MLFGGCGNSSSGGGGNINDIINCNVIVNHCPAMKLLARIYTQNGEYLKATKLPIKARDIWLALGKACEQSDIKSSLNVYLEAQYLLEKNDSIVPSGLYNNIIVLMYKSGEFRQAKDNCKIVHDTMT